MKELLGVVLITLAFIAFAYINIYMLVIGIKDIIVTGEIIKGVFIIITREIVGAIIAFIIGIFGLILISKSE